MPPSPPERAGPVPADAADPAVAAALARLHAACFPAEPWGADAIAALAAGPGADAVAIWAEGVPAGFALVRTVLDEAELLTICVAPDLRGRGTGRALLAAAMAAAGARGADRMFLEVAADNRAARALYGATGFAEAGMRRNYYRTGRTAPADALVLCAPLRTR